MLKFRQCKTVDSLTSIRSATLLPCAENVPLLLAMAWTLDKELLTARSLLSNSSRILRPFQEIFHPSPESRIRTVRWLRSSLSSNIV
jgi:hypothetical protein